MTVLVACEESQRVCISFREKGHEAYSCDLKPCSGGHPEWHIQGDVIPILNPQTYQSDEKDPASLHTRIKFQTMDGVWHCLDDQKWDLIIAHPDCTYLTVTGNRWFNVERYGDKARERIRLREEAKAFFMQFANADCDHIAIENPVGVMGTAWRPCDQTIQPWQFGHPTVKKTCLWLKGLPLLQPTEIVEVDSSDVYEYIAANGKVKHDSRLRSRCKASERSEYRSKTFWGIARAMADQWGKVKN